MAGILKEIDSWMEHIWLRVVKKEYDNGRILEESNLHLTAYFHLRNGGKTKWRSLGQETDAFYA